jgi:hypothetical protein
MVVEMRQHFGFLEELDIRLVVHRNDMSNVAPRKKERTTFDGVKAFLRAGNELSRGDDLTCEIDRYWNQSYP